MAPTPPRLPTACAKSTRSPPRARRPHPARDLKEEQVPDIVYADVAAAAQRLAGVARRTPVLTSQQVDGALGAQIFLKCEHFQRAGAFKFRGAYNTLSRFSPKQRAGGAVAFSSGNHAQAVALAARLLGISATIVMPRDAPPVKREATEGYGASVIFHDLDDHD